MEPEPLQFGSAATPVEEATFRADDPQSLWHVVAGGLDLFMVLDSEGGESRWRPLMSVPAGTLVPGLPPSDFVVIGRGAPGARVERVSRDAIADFSEEHCATVAAGINSWLEPVLDRLGEAELPPREFRPAEAGDELKLEAEEVVRPVGGVLWFEAPGARVRGRAGSRVLKPGELVPVGEGDWLVAESELTARVSSTAHLVSNGRLWEAFDAVAQQAVNSLTVGVARDEEAELQRMGRRATRDQELRAETDREFAALMEPSRNGRVTRAARDPAMAAVTIAANDLDVEARRPPPSAGLAPRVDELAEIIRASGLYSREVSLKGRWWREDAGTMIGFLGEEQRPVALLRRTLGYEVHDPATGEAKRVDAAVAAELGDTGRALYRQLPDRRLRGRDLVRFGLQGTRRDGIAFVLSGVAVAGLSLLVPIASGEILGTLVPEGDRGPITQICLALLGAAFITLLLASVQNLAALRLQGRLQAQIQEGIWGRIMRLSPSFFRRFSTGDLATRALALAYVQELLSNLGIKMAVACITAVANTILILAVSPSLGLVVLGLFGLIATVGIPMGRRSLHLQRESFDHQREVNSRSFQLVGHVGKLRAAAAEERAFAFWADAFAKGRDATYGARRIQNRFTAFSSAFALLSFAVVFLFAGQVFTVSSSSFFIFVIAYSQAMAAVLLVVVTAMNAMPAVPLLEGMGPILEVAPEVSEALADPGELSGQVELSGVSFAYSEGGPTVLDDVSMSIRPGEFVAVVGPSGSGKSTLMRLMLGFEAPTSGAVLFDEQDLSDLDVAAVRRQCGVVLQDSQLFAGDILSNVVGSGVYTADDAWEAIEMVGMDEEIAEMPMGMFTVLSEGASTLSGGQRQRIALARALVARPRMLFLDEATSALDNVSQGVVMDSMRRMNATRVVVAHRLSTIQDADRIFVMRDGRIVESGDYEELMAADGVFRRLAERQLV